MSMPLDLLHALLGIFSGSLVGFTLGFFGGGGSILAVPLIVHLVGVTDVHIAIATSAVAVAANALISLILHARNGTVAWKYATLYCTTGIVGAWIGAAIGKSLDGAHLLTFFAGLMVIVSITMYRRRNIARAALVGFSAANAPKVLAVGAGTGMISGFFGIGGGFLIVPGLMATTGMAMINAVATSLVAIVAFGLTTAASYAISGHVDWVIALTFVLGGALGAKIGSSVVQALACYNALLNTCFAGLILIVAAAMIYFR